MGKRLVKNVMTGLAVLSALGMTATPVFAAIPSFTVIFGSGTTGGASAYDVNYVNNHYPTDKALQAKINAAVVGSQNKIWVKTIAASGQAPIIDNNTGKAISDLSVIPGVTYYDNQGNNSANYASQDGIGVSAVNGTVTVTLNSVPTTPPVGATLTQTINGGVATAVTVTPSAITMAGTVVTIPVPPVAATAVDQSVVYNIAYQGATVATPAFTVPGSNVAVVTTASAITIPDVTAGTVPTLPATVNVTLSDKTTTSAAITWDAAATLPATYATAGTVTVNGVLAGYSNYPVSASVTVNAAVSKLQIVGTPTANLFLGNLSVTVNDHTLVAEVLVNGNPVTVTPSNNVYTIPITDTTDNVVFVDTAGIPVVAQKGVPQVLTASSKTYNGLMGYLSVVVNNSSLVKTVTLDGVSYTVGAAAGADGVAASVVDPTHIKVMPITASPTTVVLVSTSGLSVTVQ